MNKVVATENLSKYYGKAKVVNNVNMEILNGEIYGLVGKNGAGKTTIMKLVLSMISPSKGSVKLFNTENNKKRRTSHVTQGGTK